MKDYLIKALGYEGQVRAYAVSTTDTVGEAQRRHNTWPTASAALGSCYNSRRYDGCAC